MTEQRDKSNRWLNGCDYSFFLKINKYESNQLHFQNNQVSSAKIQEEIYHNKSATR